MKKHILVPMDYNDDLEVLYEVFDSKGNQVCIDYVGIDEAKRIVKGDYVIEGCLPDMFEYMHLLPSTVVDVIESFNGGYIGCSELVKGLEVLGFTCEYGLDASPYGLIKI